MFPSISRCDPGTIVTSAFYAQFDFALSVNTGSTFVDGVKINNGASVQVKSGQYVSGEFSAPSTLNTTTTILCTVNGLATSFDITTRGNVSISVLSEAYRKKWWNYLPPYEHTVTYRNSNEQARELELGFNTGKLSDNMHAIVDPLSSSVYFYSVNGVLIHRQILDSPPAQAVYCSSSSEEFYLIPCKDGSIYKLTINMQILSEAYLQNAIPGSMVDWIFELPFETDIPLKGSFLAFALHKVAIADSLEPKCVSFNAGKIWIGGYKKAWQLNTDLQVLKTVLLIPGAIIGIQSMGEQAIAVLKTGAVCRISSQDDIVETIQLVRWAGPPVLFGKYIAIADATNSSVMLLDSTNFYARTDISLGGSFAPSYLCTDGTSLYISGHDTHKVKVYSAGKVTEKIFQERVTFISAINRTLIASHYLKKIDTLDHSTHQEIIPVPGQLLVGPDSIIGSNPVKIKMLGGTTITPVVPAGVTWWVDGVIGAPVVNGCFFSISINRAASASYQSYTVLLGESKIKYFIKSEIATFIPRGFDIKPAIVSNGMAQVDILIPDDFTPSVASIDYGYIQRNFTPYFTGSQFVAGDLLSVFVPFGASIANVTSVLTIGAVRFSVPVNLADTETVTQVFKNRIVNSTADYNVIVPASGTYYIPEYFFYEIAIYRINEGGITSVRLSPGNIDLIAGEELTISIVNSPRIYDIRRAIIVGPTNIEIKSQTETPKSSINREILDPLIEPIIRASYDSRPITVAGLGKTPENNPIPLTLISDDPTVTLTVNGAENLASSLVVDNDTVIIRKRLTNYADTASTIFELATDPVFQDTVKVDVYTWPIVNLQLSGAVKESPLSSYTIVSNRFIYTAISEQILAGNSTLFTRNAPEQIVIRNPVERERQKSYISTGMVAEFQSHFTIVSAKSNNWVNSNLDASYVIHSNEYAIDNNENYSEVEANSYEIDNAINTFGSIVYSTEKDTHADTGTSLSFSKQHFVDNYSTNNAFLPVHPIDSTYFSLPLIKNIDYAETKVADTLKTFIHIESQNEAIRIKDIIQNINNMYFSVPFQKIHDLLHEIIVTPLEKIKGEAGVKNGNVPVTANLQFSRTETSTARSLLIAVDQSAATTILNSHHFEGISSNLVTIDGFDIIADEQLVWSEDLSNEYGAYNSAAEAEASARFRNHTPFIVLQIPDQNLFTYRLLSDVTKVCGIGGGGGFAVYAVYGLIKGG